MFDISILEIQKRVLEVKFTNGDTFLGELSEAERETLADELASLELEKVAKIFKATMANVESGSKKDDRLEPIEPSILGSTLRDGYLSAGWEESGLAEIGRGKVGGASMYI